MPHQPHESHEHHHDTACGHPQIQTASGVAFAHDGHLHIPHGDHYDETVIAVSTANPDSCTNSACQQDHRQGMAIPHGDHVDRLINGRLHHEHAGHCDDHGELPLAA